MSSAREVILCPACGGEGKSRLLGTPCRWCDGSGSVDHKTALQYASVSDVLGHGGYICGDHDYEDMQRMVSEADAIRAMVAAAGSGE